MYRLSGGRSGLSAVWRLRISGTNSSLPLGVCSPMPNSSANCVLDRIHRQDMRHALIVAHRIAGPIEVAGNPAIRIAREVEMRVNGGADIKTAEVDARLAPSLHRHHHDHAARPLRARGTAAGNCFWIARRSAMFLTRYGRACAASATSCEFCPGVSSIIL